MSRYDHEQRLTALEAMDHPYFAGVKQGKLESGGMEASGVDSSAQMATGAV